MLGITNFNPIESINAKLRPWGFTVSTKQQIISKVALASLAMLAMNSVLSTGNMQVEAACREICERVCLRHETYWECQHACPHT
ncbi:MAG: hypothetical protein ACRCU0_05575 [Candidatus Rhabdochlamydia sp.]